MLLALFAVLAVSAGEVTIGPETRLSPGLAPEVLPAAYAQLAPAVASNGRGYLAVWLDARNPALPGGVYAVRLDEQGRPVTPFAQHIGVDARTQPVITAEVDGTYAIAWNNGGAPAIVRVDEDGRVLERLAPQRDPTFSRCDWKSTPALTSISASAETYALTADAYCYTYYSLFAFVARTPGTQVMTASTRDAFSPLIQWDGSSFTGYVFERGLERTTFDPEGRLLSVVDLKRTLEDAPVFRPALGIGPDRILMAGAGRAGAMQYALFDRDGNVLHPLTSLALPIVTNATDVLWDGLEFLVVMHHDTNKVMWAQRINVEGEPVSTPMLLSANGSSRVAFATNGLSRVLLWRDYRFSSQGDIVSRAVPNFAALANPPAGDQLVSQSARAQVNVRAASSGSHRLFVWNDGQEISGSLDGRELRIGGSPSSTVSAPQVAGGDRGFLVAWRERDPDTTSRVLARRYGVDGIAVDAAPLLLAAGTRFFESSLGVASSGSSYLVTAGADFGKLVLSRLDATGDAFTVVLDLPRPTGPYNPHPVWTGSRWFIPYREFGIAAVDVSPRLDDARFVNLFPNTSYDLDVAAAAGRISYAWTTLAEPMGVHFAQTTVDGKVLSETPVAPGQFLKSAMTWNGSEYVVGWIEASYYGPPRVRAVRFNAGGERMDPQPLEIAAGEDLVYVPPAIAAMPYGAVIAYSRSDDAQTGAARVFARALQSPIPLVPRRPSVRH